MNDTQQKELGKTLWGIADKLRGAMNADDFRDYMLSFLFLRYLSDNYETAAKKELGRDYTNCEKAIEAAAKAYSETVKELKQQVIDYFEALPVDQLPVKENETDKKIIQKARQTQIDEYEILFDLLERGKVTPLGIWYIQNLDNGPTLEDHFYFGMVNVWVLCCYYTALHALSVV